MEHCEKRVGHTRKERLSVHDTNQLLLADDALQTANDVQPTRITPHNVRHMQRSLTKVTPGMRMLLTLVIILSNIKENFDERPIINSLHFC